MNIFEAWARACMPEARSIVRTVMRSRGSPLSSKEIYDLAVQQEPQTRIEPPEFKPMFDKKGRAKPLIPGPPHPTHPVRSLKFLKTVVMPSLVQLNEVQKIHTVQEYTHEELDRRLQAMSKSHRKSKAKAMAGSASMHTWLWQLKEPTHTPIERQITHKLEPEGKQVGVGQDWSHLNNRRQRSRDGKVERDLKWARRLNRTTSKTPDGFTSTNS